MFDWNHAHQLNRIEAKLDWLVKRLANPDEMAELQKVIEAQKAKADALKDAIAKQKEN